VASAPSPLLEVVRVFLKLGVIGFGGPAAHVALMREEVVKRRRWVDEQHFLDLLGAVNLIPGPNSTEMCIHLGYVRAGWPGLVAGGALFILPAMVIVLGLAWSYVRYGATPAATAALYGIKPVIIAVIVQALWGLLRTAVKNVRLAAIGILVLALYLAGVNEIGLLFGGALVAMLLETPWRVRPGVKAAVIGAVGLLSPSLAHAAAAVSYSVATLFFTFLKIGSVLYGSGYVLLAFLRNDFVNRLGWLTDRQLLDAISVGQFTPGPVLTTATFIGYVVGSQHGDVSAGIQGAVLATLAIFLPAFVFVAATVHVIPRLRKSPWTATLLDGVNVAALGLMAGVTWELGRAALVDPLTLVIAAAAAVALIRFKVNSVWLIVAGAALGLAKSAVMGH
jgi:chromate transporter